MPSALASVLPSFSSNWCFGPSQRSSARYPAAAARKSRAIQKPFAATLP